MDDVHVLTAVVEDGGGIEVALLANTLAAAKQLGTLLDGALHLLGDALKGACLHQRTHVDTLVGAGVAHLHGLHLIDEDLRELSLHFLLHIDTLGIVTDLAVVADAAVDDPLSGALEVGILAHDGRGLAAKLQRHLRDVLGGCCHDALACRDGACHRDDVNLRRAGHLVADDAAATRHDVDDACGQTCLGHYLGKLGAVLGCEL